MSPTGGVASLLSRSGEERRPGNRFSGGARFYCGMYRYRLVDDRGTDLGPLVSARLEFAAGETISRSGTERYEIVAFVPPENETFRGYLIVRRLRG